MRRSLLDVALGASLLGLLPLLVVQAVHLWERPHFQFFPLAWGALVALIATRGQVGSQAELGSAVSVVRRRRGAVVWASGLAAGVIAAVLFSPWVAEVAAILCVTGWGLLRLKAVPWTRWLGWTSLLWVTLPLPGSLDARLVGGLQTLSSESAGALLDLVGLAHLRQGNLIEIRAGKLFVDEACSGIDSLYSLSAIGLVMLLWQKRPLVVALLTLASVPLWAWFGNVLRLVFIVWMLDRWQIDLSHGWAHTLLGFVIFAISSGCLFLTLDAAGLLFRGFSTGALPKDDERWHLWYNRVVAFPNKPRHLKGEPKKQLAGSNLRASQPKVAGSASAAASTREAAKAFGWSRALMAAVVLASLFVSTLSVWAIVNGDAGSALALPHYEVAKVDSVFTEGAMPQRLLEAKRVSFHKEQRSPDSFFGEYSRIWRYQEAHNEFLLSADFPFRGFHPLWVCYTNAGNTLDGEPQTLSLPSASGQPSVGFAKLKDDLGSTSYLWFSLFDASGKPVPIQQYEDTVGNLLVERFNRGNATLGQADPITYQFQLYLPSGADLPQAELDRYLKIYAEALPHAVEQVKRLNADRD